MQKAAAHCGGNIGKAAADLPVKEKAKAEAEQALALLKKKTEAERAD